MVQASLKLSIFMTFLQRWSITPGRILLSYFPFFGFFFRFFLGSSPVMRLVKQLIYKDKTVFKIAKSACAQDSIREIVLFSCRMVTPRTDAAGDGENIDSPEFLDPIINTCKAEITH